MQMDRRTEGHLISLTFLFEESRLKNGKLSVLSGMEKVRFIFSWHLFAICIYIQRAVIRAGISKGSSGVWTTLPITHT
jgi:hypothetical protein